MDRIEMEARGSDEYLFDLGEPIRTLRRKLVEIQSEATSPATPVSPPLDFDLNTSNITSVTTPIDSWSIDTRFRSGRGEQHSFTPDRSPKFRWEPYYVAGPYGMPTSKIFIWMGERLRAPIEKFNCLIKLLEGEARSCIAGSSLTAANYMKAFRKRFDAHTGVDVWLFDWCIRAWRFFY